MGEKGRSGSGPGPASEEERERAVRTSPAWKKELWKHWDTGGLYSIGHKIVLHRTQYYRISLIKPRQLYQHLAV